MIKKLNWQVKSNDDRNKVIEQVKEVISASDGFIINFNMFSELALSLSIEIKESGIQALHKALGVVANISDYNDEVANSESTKDWLILLNITFGQGQGDLKTIVPDVPG